MKLSRRDVGTALAAMNVAVAWEESLMDANKHCRDGEYGKAKRRRDLYARTLARLGPLYRVEPQRTK
jgi:hypothetical protein